MFTPHQRNIIEHLLKWKYARRTQNHNGVRGYKLYDAGSPLIFIYEKSFRRIASFTKKDKTGKITLDRHIVRRQNGNSWIKKAYKEIRKR